MKARNIKPAFFKNELLSDCSFAARLLFIGLWCLADRNGIVEYRPKRIKAELFPYESKVNIEKLVNELSGFLNKVSGDDTVTYLVISNFQKHQSPHRNEKSLDIGDMDNLQVITRQDEELRSPLMNDDCGMRNEEGVKINSTHFVSVWETYPNRTGKGRAEKKFFSSVVTIKDLALIQQAMLNYKQMLSLPENSWRKAQDGSTWFNNWTDWIDWKPPEEIKQKASVMQGINDPQTLAAKGGCNE